MLPKSKIRLSRHLYAQTTPHPEMGRLVKRGAMLLIVVLAAGIYLGAKPPGKQTGNTNEQANPSKQILGEQVPATVEYLIYEVKKGDTLFNLAQRFEFSWQTLARINPPKKPYLLKVGQKIKIPAKE